MASTPPSPELLLAEELLLLALDDEGGFDRTMGADGGLAGALLLDLADREWLEDADGKLVPAASPPGGSTPPGVLGKALAVIESDSKPRDAKHWVRKLPSELRPIKRHVAELLVERGVLSAERRKMLGFIPHDRYPEADPEPERALRERLRAELTGRADVSPRTALLVPLLRAYDLVQKLVDKDDRKQAKRRATQIADDPGKVGAAVRSALTDTQIAVYVAVGSAVAVNATDGGAGGGDGGGG
ncbi:MAG: GPP34 family phosphoprotein [Actinomycetota bacterium]|nr:GPP34 family phosphoprotein [Actinomycetota bacterium]